MTPSLFRSRVGVGLLIGSALMFPACQLPAKSGGDTTTDTGGGSGAGSGSSGGVPESCPIRPPTDDVCLRFDASVGCCFPSHGCFGEGCGQPPNECRAYVGQDPPPLCVSLYVTALECGIAASSESCADFIDFYVGSRDNHPPTDPAMPCYTEVMALWDEGCDPSFVWY
jgi:hypothetical protein